jgi:flagellar basal-body rod protein FlgC
MLGAIANAASGLSADATWLDTIASNVANMRDESALPGSPGAGSSSFKPTDVAFSADSLGGVAASTTPTRPAYTVTYDPAQPFADQNGLVATPNLDLAGAFVDQAMALQGYRANAAVFTASEKMMKTTLDMMC